MKIAYIRSSFPKGTETFILEEILALRRAGHEVRISARWSDLAHLNKKILQNDLLACVECDERQPTTWRQGIETVRLFLLQFAKGRKYRAFFRHSFFGELDVKTRYRQALAERVRGMPRWRRWLQAWRLNRHTWMQAMRIHNLSLARHQFILKQTPFEPDVMHCPFLFAWDAAKLRQLVARYPDVPYSVTLRSRDLYFDNPNPHYVRLRKQLIEQADQVFAISEFNRREVHQRFDLARDVQVVHSSIDTQLFTPEPSNQRNPRHMVSVARLIPKKGLEVAIDACALLAADGVPFKLTLVGAGPLRDELLARIDALGLVGKVEIVGPLKHLEVKNILSRCAVFVLPCVVAGDGDRDMLPNSLKEAMAMQLAVVTSAISGIEELIEDGVTGLLAQPNDAADLAAKMRTLLTDRARVQLLGQLARASVVRDFSITGEGAKFVAALERTVQWRSAQLPALPLGISSGISPEELA